MVRPDHLAGADDDSVNGAWTEDEDASRADDEEAEEVDVVDAGDDDPAGQETDDVDEADDEDNEDDEDDEGVEEASLGDVHPVLVHERRTQPYLHEFVVANPESPREVGVLHYGGGSVDVDFGGKGAVKSVGMTRLVGNPPHTWQAHSRKIADAFAVIRARKIDDAKQQRIEHYLVINVRNTGDNHAVARPLGPEAQTIAIAWLQSGEQDARARALLSHGPFAVYKSGGNDMKGSKKSTKMAGQTSAAASEAVPPAEPPPEASPAAAPPLPKTKPAAAPARTATATAATGAGRPRATKQLSLPAKMQRPFPAEPPAKRPKAIAATAASADAAAASAAPASAAPASAAPAAAPRFDAPLTLDLRDWTASFEAGTTGPLALGAIVLPPGHALTRPLKLRLVEEPTI